MYLNFIPIFFLICCSNILFDTISESKKITQLCMKKVKNEINPLYIPKNKNQDNYVKILNDEKIKIVISTGPAGCGKTLLSTQKAVNELMNNNINKIIITRPIVTVDEEIGFLPGTMIQKMDPWIKPIFDIFMDFYSKQELDKMFSDGTIEICPLAFMRGRTFKHSFIIADEMQNSSPNQMKMLVTRIGDNCKMVITGDLEQTDLIKENGLYDFTKRFEKINKNDDILDSIKYIKFDNNDIERSDIVKKVIKLYDN